MSSSGSEDENEDELGKFFKVILIGDDNIGKTSILKRYGKDEFEDSGGRANSRDGDYFTKSHQIDSEAVRVQLWDPAGQERFRTLTSSFYRGTSGVLLVYDVCNKDSFESMKNQWIGEAIRYSPPGTQFIIVGNKVDRVDEDCRQVPFAGGKAVSDAQGVDFMEISAKTGSGINEAIVLLTKKILARKESPEESSQRPEESPQAKKSSCCLIL